MKKVGILTTYFSRNYGAALQAYALRRAVQSLGFQADILPYHSRRRERYVLDAARQPVPESPGTWVRRRLRNLRVKLFGNGLRKEDLAAREQAFARFVDTYLLPADGVYESPESFLRAVPRLDYAAYICGSDQIWNPLCHNFDPVYFLNFPTTALRLSYAPSIALNTLSDRELRRIAANIATLDALSVRERDAKDLLQPYLPDRPIEVVIDPTFLLRPDEWGVLQTRRPLPDRYILVYLLEYNALPKDAVRCIREYARAHKAEILCLPYTRLSFGRSVRAQYLYDVAPDEFIALLRGALCVFTNSFHATALSINHNREFYVFLQPPDGVHIQSRITNLLEEFGVSGRGIATYADFAAAREPLAFAPINERIRQRSEAGYAYLRRALTRGNGGASVE